MFRGASRRRNKYNRTKVELDGITFDSKLEAAVYQKLKADPGILDVYTQEKVYLTKAQILCKIDFMAVLKTGEVYFVEAKGKSLPVWNIKKRLWKCYGPARLEVYKGSYLNPKLEEIIEPKVEFE